MVFERLYPDLGVAIEPGRGRRRSVPTPLLVPAVGSRSSAVFNVHSYHTKVPAEAIEPFIEHHTQPGAVVLDPFAGSGMTGVAAQRLGRRAVLNDLSPAASHIAWNVTHSCDAIELGLAAERVLAASVATQSDLYGAGCGRCGEVASLAFTIWSDVLLCPACRTPTSVWDGAADKTTGTVAATLRCGSCEHSWPRRGSERLRSTPSWVATDCPKCGRVERPASKADLLHIESVEAAEPTDWYPTTPLGPDREMYIRSALGLRGVRSVADFYTARNLRALASIWAPVLAEPDLRLRQALALAFTNTAWHGTVMRRYNARGGQRPLTGTLYIPHLSSEVNVRNVFAHKIRQLQRFYATDRFDDDHVAQVSVGSAADLHGIADGSIDYVFTDPPFGSNIFYADCNLIWESWLGRLTDSAQEAVVNRSLRSSAGGKSVRDYQAMMTGSFAEIARVLRRDAWMTVVFHSTDANVWEAIESSAKAAGLSIQGATYLDKKQFSPKGYKGRSGSEDVAAYDVVLAVRNRPAASRPARRHEAHRRERAAGLLREHLAALPAVGVDKAADARRTLPYLHSLLVQHHFNGDIGLQVGDYELVRSICAETLSQDAEGRWAVPT